MTKKFMSLLATVAVIGGAATLFAQEAGRATKGGRGDADGSG